MTSLILESEPSSMSNASLMPTTGGSITFAGFEKTPTARFSAASTDRRSRVGLMDPLPLVRANPTKSVAGSRETKASADTNRALPTPGSKDKSSTTITNTRDWSGNAAFTTLRRADSPGTNGSGGGAVDGPPTVASMNASVWTG